MSYKYHSFDLQRRAAQLLREIPKPEGVDDFTYRRLAHFEFHPVLDQLSFGWLWSAADTAYLVSPIDPSGARADVSWSLITATEWQTLQRMQLGALDSVTPELLRDLQPRGWGVVTDTILDFKQRADAAREPDNVH